jgi:hypothetical protein
MYWSLTNPERPEHVTESKTGALDRRTRKDSQAVSNFRTMVIDGRVL